MPLGILDDGKLEHVPGTAPLNDLQGSTNYPGIDPSLLKHDPTGQIVLVPQPSDSSKNPYNWPRKKKELFTITYGWGCGRVGSVKPLLEFAFVPLAEEFDVPLTTFVSGNQGGTITAIAIGSLLFKSLAVKYRKRPVYPSTTVGLMVSCFWAAEAKSLPSLVAARVVCGLFMASMEALIPASIADIWFVHGRGFRTAIFNLGVLGEINLAIPIAGGVIEDGSYRISLHPMGGAFGLAFIMIFFWMTESAYAGRNALDIDTGNETFEVTIEGKENIEQLEHASGTDLTTQESEAEASPGLESFCPITAT
ncbi:hypothetical protein N7460_007347 [Penicillium canescens]|uniref:Major facilitator superfamily (MFS) profile domain-containing protein n=1 Tax=Penicillium canescens TaxID=5083 RepID=A0AAD6N7F6_PENCN|nr:hypothetical protein N7460_007347 [Penicillium canescens]KAJ6060024.1 hypothetical protein N7444_002956 [Penicillium canescens]